MPVLQTADICECKHTPSPAVFCCPLSCTLNSPRTDQAARANTMLAALVVHGQQLVDLVFPPTCGGTLNTLTHFPGAFCRACLVGDHSLGLCGVQGRVHRQPVTRRRKRRRRRRSRVRKPRGRRGKRPKVWGHPQKCVRPSDGEFASHSERVLVDVHESCLNTTPSPAGERLPILESCRRGKMRQGVRLEES